MESYEKNMYQPIFKDYPDVLDVKQVSEILNVSTKTIYRLLRVGDIESLKIGREFRIPKVNLLRYIRVLGVQSSDQSTKKLNL